MPYIITQDIERVTFPWELLVEPLYSRAEKLIAEMYEKQDLAPETKLDVPMRSRGFYPLECAHGAQTQKKPPCGEPARTVPGKNPVESLPGGARQIQRY